MSIEIIGLQEYQDLIERSKKAGYTFSGNEIHCFHAEFVGLLDSKMPSIDYVIYLDHIKSFSDFPTDQGIYFCVRWSTGSEKEIWYVGKAGNFRNRWKNHHKFHALRAIQEVVVYCLPLEGYSQQQIDYAERAYIKMLTPVFNNTSKPEKYLSIAS